MPEGNGRTHRYHAEAGAINGSLLLPFEQPIEPQAHAKVPEKGGYLSQHSESFRVEGIVSYGAAHTQVSGHQEVKKDRGFKTLATAVVEDLNVLNVVTADRVVAQVSTEHPLNGYVPKVTFLGTQFENLRIAGCPVKVDFDWDILSDQPDGKSLYTRHPGFMQRVAGQLGLIRKQDNLHEEIVERYGRGETAIDLRESAAGESTEFSLVKKVECCFPDWCFGHVIDIPNFGRVYLAVVRITHSDPTGGNDFYKQTLIDLTMIEIKMGCLATGSMKISNTINNGSSGPPLGGGG
jgi:hypothetical protein